MLARRPHSGFTLIELLTAVGIITILIVGLINIPWSNIGKYARSNATEEIEAMVASARMVAMERGKQTAVIFTQSSQSNTAYMFVAIDSGNNTDFNTTIVDNNAQDLRFVPVEGMNGVLLPQGITVRAPASIDVNPGASSYQTTSDPAAGSFGSFIYDTSGGFQGHSPDNVVSNAGALVPTKIVKCFAICFDNQGRLLTNGYIKWYDGNIDFKRTPNDSVGDTFMQPSDLANIPFAPYVAVLETNSLLPGQPNGTLSFDNGGANQSLEQNFIFGNPSKVKFLAFNRYSGNALRK